MNAASLTVDQVGEAMGWLERAELGWVVLGRGDEDRWVRTDEGWHGVDGVLSASDVAMRLGFYASMVKARTSAHLAADVLLSLPRRALLALMGPTGNEWEVPEFTAPGRDVPAPAWARIVGPWTWNGDGVWTRSLDTDCGEDVFVQAFQEVDATGAVVLTAISVQMMCDNELETPQTVRRVAQGLEAAADVLAEAQGQATAPRARTST